jgi:chromate reductase, NAD(P)H dehydrogenase (quinone)
MKKEILILNGSINGELGNTSVLLNEVIDIITKENHPCEATIVNLANTRFNYSLFDKIVNADAYIFGSGTYWDSWGSPLQSFLEWLTPLEGNSDILGKPAGVVITGHSVGAKSILSRLQGVLSTFGLTIPPMTGMVYTLASQESRKALEGLDFKDEMWSRDDLYIIVNNLLEYEKIRSNCNFLSWTNNGSEFCDKVWINL